MKNKSALFNLNKGYKSPLEGNAFGAKLKENMDNGMSKSEAAAAAASALSNLNKGYGQQVKSPLETDGIIIKALRSIGSDYERFKTRKKRIESGSAIDPKLQGVPTKSPKFSTGGYDKTAADAKLKNDLAKSAEIKDMPLVKDATAKRPGDTVKTKPRKKVNALKSNFKSTDKQKLKTTGPKVKSAEAKADLTIMPIVKDATSSRKSRRLEKTIGKAVEARNKGEKAIKNIKSSSSASDIAKNQAKALKQRRKYDRMKKRAGRIGKRM